MDILGNFSKLGGDKKKRQIYRKKELEYSVLEADVKAIGRIEEKEASHSIIIVKAVIFLLFCFLCFRLFYLQVVMGQSNQKLAEGNRIRPRIIDASRGVITDSSGVFLARNAPSFSLALYPSDLPKKKSEREAVYEKISKLSNIPKEEITKEAERSGLLSLDMVTLKENIDHDEALILEKKIAGLSGVIVAKRSIREYAVLPGIAHILGYTGKVSEADLKDDKNIDYYLSDRIGKIGLETEYEKELRGKHGVEQIEVDSKGNIARVLVQEENRNPVAGSDLTLYLDRGLQQKTAEALQKGIDEGVRTTGNEVKAGVAMVMDVKTGGILAMVSLPDYNNNLFTTKVDPSVYKTLSEDKSSPMFNRAIAGTYPPGSIIKIVMASAGLSEGNISVNTSFDTPPEIKIGDYVFPDWKDHGMTNIVRAIAESNNIFFYSIGGGFDKIKGLGIEKVKKYWQLFGLGEETGIDLPSEASGLLPDPDWKEKVKKESWYLGDTYHVSIGQGDLLITPIQMLRTTATIANGGTLLHPQLVKKISDHDGKVIKEFGPRVERENFISQSIIKTVQEGMRLAVTGGSAQNMQDLPVPVAGKTGTAQFLNNQKTHAWFECYAPYNDSQIAVIVMVEGGGGGREISAPVAHEILQYYFTR